MSAEGSGTVRSVDAIQTDPGRRRASRVSELITTSHVRAWLLLVAAALGLGVVGFIVVERWSLSDALYMTVISLTTVGFKEVNELSESGRVITMLTSIAGVGLIFGGVGIIGEYLFTEATSGARERRRMERTVRELRDHYILCGYGRVGGTAARQLREDAHPLVVVDLDASALERARADGQLVVQGDASEEETLLAAGIERARGLITTLDSDANNVYVVLTARAIKPDLRIVGRANTTSAEAKLTQAGADTVVSPYRMAGQRIAEIATRPGVVQFLDAALSSGELAFSLEEVRVKEGGPLAGRTVADLRAQGIHTLAIVQEEGYDAHPEEARSVEPGDVLIVSGSAGVLAGLG